MSNVKKGEQPLPSVDSVLNKLKSDGTFDQFRRTCLEHIQGEPSFRAYSEHLEVVSRRYLQNFKWKESSTKNEVRGRLRDHALNIIVSPDIQVGTPLIDIVEKVLESKAKHLLPKITEAVDFLCETRAKQLQETQLHKELIHTPTQPTDSPKPDIVDLSLPIDIPGLNTPPAKKEPARAQGVSSGRSQQDGRSKVKKSEGNKDLKTGAKSKPVTAGSTNNKPVEGPKAKEQRAAVKEEPKEKPRYRIPKKPKVDNSSDKQETEAKEIRTEGSRITTASGSKEKNTLIDEPQPQVKRRSARIASQTDSKASSDMDVSDDDDEMPPTKKRARTPIASRAKRSRVVADSSSEGSEGNSDSYELGSNPLSDEENLQEIEETKKQTRPVHNETNTKSKKLSKTLRATKSLSVVVTRYNRSVKPNRKYCMYDASSDIEEGSQSTVDEMEGEGVKQATPLILHTAQQCDIGPMEIEETAILRQEKQIEDAYEMLMPKPSKLSIRKNLIKGWRSRRKTSTRINFFHHR